MPECVSVVQMLRRALPAHLCTLLLALALTLALPLGACSAPEYTRGSAQPASDTDEDRDSTPPAGSLTPEQKKAVLQRADQLVRERAFASGVEFAKWADILARYQARLDRASTAAEFSRHLNRALNEFGISHIDLLPPDMARDRRETSYGGIGITVGTITDEGIPVMQVRSGSPAEEAGLKVGDIVTQVDGQRPQGMGAIRGKPGTSVTLTVKRGETSSTMTITRADLSKATPPEVVMLGADAAVLRLESFTEGYEKPLLNRLLKQVKDTPYLVIDLRSNGGGSVDNLSHLLGLLLPQGTPVGTFVSKRMVADYVEKTGKNGDDVVAVAQWASRKLRPQRVGGIEPYKGRVAVLINGASASASEILAAAMRELRGAPLVGTKTAGAVLLSTYVRMEGGFEMKVPTSDYVTIEGERLESNPLVPDRTVGNRWGRRGAPVAPDDDPAVQAALEALRENADAGALPRE